MRSIGASDFKARCLAILDEVARTGESVQVLKRGKVVARLIAVAEPSAEFPQDTLAGTVSSDDDLLAPAVDEADVDAVSGRELRHTRKRSR